MYFTNILRLTFYLPWEAYISGYYILNLHKVETFPMLHNLRGSQSWLAVQTIFKIDRKLISFAVEY